MKNLKKVLALVLACVMVFGTVAMAGSVYPDVADDAIYAESVKTLSALGIIKGDENGNFNPDATVTRAEMAKILCTMLGTGELAQANTSFSDVPSSHWASGYVNYAQQYGCIAGYGDGTFGPEDPVTYEQVIKLVMAALGYTFKAEENGGYPTGYLYVAADREVTERAIGNGPEPALRSTVAIIVNNAMNTPVMERTTYGTEVLWEELDGTNYKIFKTLLTSRHKTYKVEGKVVNSYKGKPELKDGFVDTVVTDSMKIDVVSVLGADRATGRIYNISAAGTDAADYVGYESYLYYKVDAAGDVSLICVSPKSARNKTVVIDDVDNIYDSVLDSGIRTTDIPKAIWEAVDTNDDGTNDAYAVSKYVFAYWNDRDTDNRITTVDLDKNVSVYVNDGTLRGLSMTTTPVMPTDNATYTTSTFYNTNDVVNPVKPDRGSVTLVDTDNDGDYDLIKVDTADIAVVDTINTKSNRINFKIDGKSTASLVNFGAASKIILSKDTHKNLREYSITIDGVDADVADLQEYDVLSIKTNDWSDPTYFYIDVIRSVVEGTITAAKTSGNDQYVVIGGEKYKAANNIQNMSMAALTLEETGKFYLDADGDIVMKDTTSVLSGDYAYLYSVGNGNFAGETYVRLFNKDGEDVTYRLADKVKINGVQAKSATYVFTQDDLTHMFVNPSASPANTAAADVSDLFNTTATPASYNATAVPSPVADVAGTDPLTAENLVKALVQGFDKTARTGFAIEASFAPAGLDEQIAKFVTYKADSNNNITELNIAASWATQNQFGYVGTPGSVKWKESLGMFEASASLPENAVVFYAKAADSISDYAVKTVADLVDGSNYTPYFFTATEEGPAAVLMLAPSTGVNTKASFAIFAGSSDIKVDGDAAYSVTYWKDGALVETPLVVAGDATVAGMATSVPGMQVGDAFIYSIDDDGIVDDIKVMFSPNAAPSLATPTVSTALTETLIGSGSAYVSDAGLTSDFEFYGTVGNMADNELIFGIIGKAKSIADGVRLTILDNDGIIANGKTINIPSSAKVVYYNATARTGREIVESAVTDLAPSNVVRFTNDDIDFANVDFTIDDLNYAFVRVYKDVVTEVIFVRYASDN